MESAMPPAKGINEINMLRQKFEAGNLSNRPHIKILFLNNPPLACAVRAENGKWQ